MNKVLGTGSLCGGRGTVPEAWLGIDPPVPTCQQCGGRKKHPYGPVIEMEPPTRSDMDGPLSKTLIAAVIPDRAEDAMRWIEKYGPK